MRNNIFWILLIFLAGMVVGVTAHHYQLIDGQLIRDNFHFRKALNEQEKSKILKDKKTMILMVFGQSNSANYGEGTYEPHGNVFNYYKGDVFPAKEPLLGADGKGVSVWTRFADLIIRNGIYNRVILVPFGIGQTSVGCWTHGECHDKLKETMSYLRKDRLKPTAIFWFQGETDNVDGTTKAVYKADLKQIIQQLRENGFDAPFFSSITSYVPFGNDNYLGIDKDIREAQMEVVSEEGNAFKGPDTDSLNLAYYRTDYVHFTSAGLDTLAAKWFKSFVIHKK